MIVPLTGSDDESLIASGTTIHAHGFHTKTTR
jgi:hypothetical protein